MTEVNVPQFSMFSSSLQIVIWLGALEQYNLAEEKKSFAQDQGCRSRF